jgi:hypothetical protein
MNTPPKYPSTSHWPWSPEVHRDDSTHPNPENFVGVEVVITEKLDGGNTCLSAGEVYARSTGQPATQGWFAMVKKHHAWKTVDLDPRYSIYGEDVYGIHSIEYDAIPEDMTYRVFNILDNDIWLSWAELEVMAALLNLHVVPVLFQGVFNNVKDITRWMEEAIKEPSSLGPQREGFVMRYAARIDAVDFTAQTAKYVRKGHVQTDEHWTRNWKPIPLVKA